MADDSNRDGINPLFGIAGQIMGEFGVPDQIELTTTVDGEPVQMDLVYEGDNGEYGQSADRGSGLTGRAFSLSSAKLDDRTGSKYVFERDRGPGTIH